jgi:hypothetical protein
MSIKRAVYKYAPQEFWVFHTHRHGNRTPCDGDLARSQTAFNQLHGKASLHDVSVVGMTVWSGV